MNRHKYFLSLYMYSLGVFCFALHGQDSSFLPEPKVVVDSIQTFENYTVEDGLSNNTIYDILEDKYGFIWVATGLGLSRFNGKTFKNYYHNPLDPTTISDNKINRLAEDSEGNLWVGTANGLNKFIRKDESFQRYYQDKHRSDGLPGNHIRAILADTAGIIWLETANGFFSCFDTKYGKFENYGHEPAETRYPVHTIKKRKNGNILILGRRVNLREFNVHTRKLEEFSYLSRLEQYYFLSSFQELSDGTILFNNSANKSFITDAAISSHQTLDKLASIYDVVEGEENILWMGGFRSGAIQYDLNSHEITSYKKDLNRKESIISNFIFKVYKDKSGQIWFGTNGGLSRMKTKQFIQHIKNPSGSNKVTAIVPSSDEQQLWIATQDHGVFNYNLITNTYKQHIQTPQLITNMIQNIHLDKEGLLWIGSWAGRGFDILDTKTDKIKKRQLCDNRVYDWWTDILETKNGDLYLSSWGMGPMKFNRTSLDFYPDHWLPAYYQERGGQPILVTSSKLYYNYDSRLSCKDLKSGGMITTKKHYYEDYHCAYKYNPFIKYSLSSEKFTTKHVIEKVKLLEGQFWITTNFGDLFQADTTQLEVTYSPLNTFQDTIVDLAIQDNYYLLEPSFIKVVSTEQQVRQEIKLPHAIDVQRYSSIQVVGENILVNSPDYLQLYHSQSQTWKLIDLSKKSESIKTLLRHEGSLWLVTSNDIYTVSL